MCAIVDQPNAFLVGCVVTMSNILCLVKLYLLIVLVIFNVVVALFFGVFVVGLVWFGLHCRPCISFKDTIKVSFKQLTSHQPKWSLLLWTDNAGAHLHNLHHLH